MMGEEPGELGHVFFAAAGVGLAMIAAAIAAGVIIYLLAAVIRGRRG